MGGIASQSLSDGGEGKGAVAEPIGERVFVDQLQLPWREKFTVSEIFVWSKC